MPLYPILPVLPDESLGSYLRRVGLFHTGREIYGFLDVIELSRGAVMAPKEADLDRICRLTGQSLATLQTMVSMSAGPRVRRFGRETFRSDFCIHEQTSFCPACLLEDAASDSPSGGLRVGRMSWSFEPVRTCRHHGIPLVRRRTTSYSERFQQMDEVAPGDAELVSLVAAAERRAPSVMQDYVENRLAGGRGPDWLDAQPIDEAVRTCEWIGLLLAYEPTRHFPTTTSSVLDAAGAAGFHHAARGADGICEALRTVQDRGGVRRQNSGPQATFGFFYNALQFDQKRKSFGPIREVARNYILDHFAIEAGTMLLGKEVTVPRKHTAHTLARRFSEHPRTVQGVLTLAGLLDRDATAQAQHHIVDAAPAEALIAKLKTALTARELMEHLNCNRMQAALLVRSGIIPRIITDPDRAQGVTKQVARDDVDAFLARLLGAARKVDSPSEGMTDIVTAAVISRWPVADIVAGIFAGLFARVECTDPGLRFKGVLVSPDEVRRMLNRQGAEDHIGIREAAHILDMRPYGFSTLVKLRDTSGQPFVREHRVANAKGVEGRVYSRVDVEAFRDRHVALRDIGAVHGLSPKWIKEKLDGQGILPIAHYKGIGRLYYRRDDLIRFDPA